MQNRPHLKEYVMARLVTIATAIFMAISVLMLLLIGESVELWWAVGLMALSFMVLIYAIYRGADRMEKELQIINNYLSKIDKIESIDYKAQFFTQEFEEINQNLIKVLKASKKREDIKQRYNAKLKLKNRQRGDMISAIAHEFRNPVASIVGYAQTLEEDKEIPDALREKFLRKIYNNGLKIEALLGRLVLWNKFESKEAHLHPVKFDIFELAKEVKGLLQEKYPQRLIELEGKSHQIEADRALMEIVLKNLIENALKYSQDEVRVAIENDRVSVIDKGAGIAASEIDKVTKKFYRAGTHSWDNSMGLGLSIVKSILRLHGSSLEIESEEGRGSTFSFTI